MDQFTPPEVPPGAAAAVPVSRWRRWLRHLPTALGILLLFGAVYVVQKEFRHLKIADIERSLAGIPRRSLALSAACTVAAYFVLSFYDRLGSVFAGRPVSFGRSFFASFCAYTLSHNLGLAAVSGAAVRYRLYAAWGLSPVEVAKVIAFCSLTFGLGAFTLGGLILWVEPEYIPFLGAIIPVWAMRLIAVLMFGIVGGYVALSKLVGTLRWRGHEVELPSARMALMQVGLATIDVATTASIFYVLLPHATLYAAGNPAGHLTWFKFVGVYLASYSAGLAANLPGGIGVFDGAMLLGLAPWLDAPVVLSAVLVFRLYYYIIPLFLAGGLFTGSEIMRGGGVFSRFSRSRPVVNSGPKMRASDDPDLAVGAATGAVALCGALLLALNELVPPPDFGWIANDFAPDLYYFAEGASEYVASLIGAALLVLAVGLAQRVRIAWDATVVLLVLAAAFSVAQGERLWVPAMLALTALLIAPFRYCFYRSGMRFSGKIQASSVAPLFALIACVLALAIFRREARYVEDGAWWELVLSHGVSNGTRATIALAVVVGIVAALRLIWPVRVRALPWEARARALLAAIGGELPECADGLVEGEAGRAAIAFRRMGRFVVGLGDPAGAEADRLSAIWRLRDLAQQEGRDAAFVGVGVYYRRVYADLGLTPVPLNADGQPMPEAPLDEASHFLMCVVPRDVAPLIKLLHQQAPVRVTGPVV